MRVILIFCGGHRDRHCQHYPRRVSGGTMAVSMGIYDKLIGAVSNLFKT